MADGDIPAEAVEAGAIALNGGDLTLRLTIARTVLAAAEPHIRADECARVLAEVNAALRDRVKFLAWHRQANRPLHSVTHAEVAAYYLRDVLGDS